MNKIIAIKDNYAVEIIPDSYEKHITVQLVDEVNNITTTLAVWFGGKWSSDSPVNINKFFGLLKQYPRVKRNVKKAFTDIKNGPHPSQNINKTWSCFKRRFNVSIHNITK